MASDDLDTHTGPQYVHVTNLLSTEDLRARLELTAEAESTLKERVEKLEEELEAERSKGFWRRLFGG